MKKIAIAVALVVTVTGCAQMPGMKNMTPQQQAQTEGCAMGTLLGGALGAGAGAIFGGGQGAAIGGGLGAVLGGAAGCTYANGVIDENELLTKQENELNGYIQEARNHNQQLTQEISDIQSNIAQIKRGIKNKKERSKLLAAQRTSVKQKLATEKQREDALSHSIDQLAAAKANQPAKSVELLDKKIGELQAQLTTLKDNNRALASISQKI